ncbi:hypothetical protein J8J27_34450, partial [Mycobacterium tuberculosis]|nr:hypothetical protein [Mycobacterium tuberculosis]
GFLYSSQPRDVPNGVNLLAKALGRLPRMAFALLRLPFAPGESLIALARLNGEMVGFFDAMRGLNRHHYENVTGS